MGSKDDFILKDEKSVKRRLHCQIYSTFSSHFMFWIYFDECFIDKNLLHISLRPFVNLGIRIGIGIGTNTTNAIISSSIRPMNTKPSRVVI